MFNQLEFTKATDQGMSLEDILREIANNNLSMEQEKLRFQQESLSLQQKNLLFETKTRAKMQSLSDQLTQITNSVRRFEEPLL